MIIAKLEQDEIELKNCRGQGYDNGSNMAAAYNGVQSHILKLNNYAKFIPCAAHSLNLVGVNAAERVLPSKMALGQVQNFFVFFSSSTSRSEFLRSKTKINLKGHSDTRWSSKSRAVSALFEQYPEVVETLNEMCLSEMFNSETLAGASALLNIAQTFKFLLSITVWNSILVNIDMCNIALQKQVTDIHRSVLKLSGLLSWLKEFRVSGFSKSYDKALEIANIAGIDENSGFTDVRSTRGRKRKMPGETAEDTPMTNKQRFEVEFFNELMDNIVTEISKRFNQLNTCFELFSFLYGAKLNELTEDKLAKHAMDLSLEYEADFDSGKLVNEIKFLKHEIKHFVPAEKTLTELSPLEILNLIYLNELESCFPYVVTGLKIYLTLPVTVATNERSFSKLKIIMNYLRSSMGQERLSNFGIISIEYSTVENLSFKELISEFANNKCRRVSIRS